MKTSEATVNISKLNKGMYILKVSSSQKNFNFIFY
ncbi:MAG: T9SS type A sorting domain-containing protein [Bacteroidetes bacterium]|nr:T9SS type A sorting domain-containing protein [Bacteroidota bacterium]